MTYCDIVIVGAGPAGMAAAVSAYEHGARDIIVIERDSESGGILNQCVHNGFGLHRFGEELTGPEYAERYADMLKDTSVVLKLSTTVLDISDDGERKTVSAVSSENGFEQISARAVILAMGCRERSRGAVLIPGVRGRGVFTAGSAQRYLNMEGYLVGRRVVILGSGDIGLIMARRMTLEGAKVLAVVEIMPYANGLSRNIAQCLDDFDIPLYLSHTVTNIIGKNRLEAVIVSQVDENRNPIEGTDMRIDCDALLLSVGLVPENELSRNAGINIDRRTNGACVDERMQTSLEGVFACGNVLHVHDLVDYVSEESALAGKSAAEYVLSKHTESDAETVYIKNGENVGYTVPQRFCLGRVQDSLEVMFRARKRLGKCSIDVCSEGERIASFKRAFLLPAEMEKITLPKALLEKAQGDLEITVVETGEE